MGHLAVGCLQVPAANIGDQTQIPEPFLLAVEHGQLDVSPSHNTHVKLEPRCATAGQSLRDNDGAER